MKTMSRLLWTAVLLVASTQALAAPGKGRAIGGAKDDDLSPVVPSETALLRGLMYAFEPAPLEIHLLAIEDLGLLGDPRALNALAQLTLDATPAVAKSAVRAIGAIRHPRAEEILSNLIRHPSVVESTKLAAMELLPFQNSLSSAHLLQGIAQTPGWPPNLQSTARRLAAELTPAPLTPPAPALQPVAPAAPAVPASRLGDDR